MDDQKNLLYALGLSTLVMLGYWFFFAKPLGEEYRQQAELEAQMEQESTSIAPSLPDGGLFTDLRPRDSIIQEEQRIQIDSPSLSGSFQLQGNRFDDITLKNYKQTLEDDSENVVMLSPVGAKNAAYIMDNWVGTLGDDGGQIDWQLVSGDTLSPETPVVLEHYGQGYQVTRTISVDDYYLITLTDRVQNTSSDNIVLTRTGASRQYGLPENLTNFFILQEGPISIVDGKLEDMKYKKLSDKKRVSHTGESGWVGLTDKYWLSAAIAPQGRPMTSEFNFRTLNTIDIYEAVYRLDPVTITPGATIESVGYVFAGAKDRDVLLSYENDLGISQMEMAIDWGMLRILTRPMTWALSSFGHWLGNFGLGIMLLTLIIKILLFPLFNKQYESQAKMKKVQPRMKKLQTLYKDDRMKLQQEMMALYRKEGVNPVAGCLPIIPTIFVFFALYKSVFINVELRHAPFFGWIQDLSERDPLSILNGFGLFPWTGIPDGILSFFAVGPLGILYGVTMAAMFMLTPPQSGATSEQAAIQSAMFKFMPWIFMFILAPFAAGLLVYWVWNNVLSFLQQYYITRKFKVDTPVDAFFRKITGKAEKASAAEE